MPQLAAVIVHVVHSDASMRRTNPPRRAGVAAAWQQTAAGREPWEAGTGRLDLKVQNGTVPEVQLRWGVVMCRHLDQSVSRGYNQLLARHTRLQPGVRISALVITSNYRVITGNYQVITG